MKITIRNERVQLFDGSENIRIVLLTDTHWRWSQAKPEQVLHAVQNIHPDLVVGGGDYYDVSAGAQLFAQFLRQLTEEYHVALIPGNHEKWTGLDRFSQLIHESGAVNLCLEPFHWQTPAGNRLSFYHSSAPLEKSLRGKKVLVKHNPEHLQAADFEANDLILSGHLHGGQVICFTSKGGAHYPGSFAYRHCCDRKTIGKGTLIVSKGLGDTLPLRVRCPHEIVVIQIH